MENSETEQGLPHGDLFRKVEYLPLTQIQNTAFGYCDSDRTYIANGLFNLVSPFHILLLGSYWALIGPFVSLSLSQWYNPLLNSAEGDLSWTEI